MNFFKKLWSLFKKKEQPKDETPKPIETKPEIPTEPKKENRPRIAVVRGHGSRDSGAEGCGTNEVEYNTKVMQIIEKANIENVRFFYGEKSIDAITKSITYLPEITIQLHLNSADNKNANGCEVLVIEGDYKSYDLAEDLAAKFTTKFKRKMRRPETMGKKILNPDDRGYTSLKISFGKKVLLEPFFISNESDYVSPEEYAAFLIDYIKGIK